MGFEVLLKSLIRSVKNYNYIVNFRTMRSQRLFFSTHQPSLAIQDTMVEGAGKQVVVFIFEHPFTIRQVVVILVSTIPL